MSAIAADCRLAPRLDCPAAGFRAAKDAKPIRDVEYYEYQRAGKVWKGFGKIGLRDALVHSSNVYFAQLGTQISAKTFNAYVSALGITNALTLYQGAAGSLAMGAGGIPAVEDADRKMRAQLAIGQGKMAVSPLHVAMWTSAIANGGVLAPPHLERERPPEAPSPHRVFAKATAGIVEEMMRDVIKHGTGRKADIPGAGICGKTGTAQTPKGADHSWFTCFTCETQPRIVVTILVEHGGFGARAALPVARDLVEEALRLGVVRSKTWKPPQAAGGAR
jgi:peptidoglycan glycosyltransferase